MDTPHESYLKLLNSLSDEMEKLTHLAQKKTNAVMHNDLLALDEVMKQEQVVSLNLRGKEQKRLKLVAQLGLQNVKLSQLAQHYPRELALQAQETSNRLHQNYETYQAAAQVARNTLEINLHEIELIIKSAGVDPDQGSGYQPPNVEPPKNMKTDFRA